MRAQSVPRHLGTLLLTGVLSTVGCGPTIKPPPVPPLSAARQEPVAPADGDVAVVVKRQEEENALLRERLGERDDQVDVLQGEVHRLQTRTKEMEATLARLGAAAAPSAATPSSPTAPAELNETKQALSAAEAAAQTAHQQLASAQDELAQERRRRERVETELARLKQETSTAPLAPPAALGGTDADAVRQAHAEIEQLRGRLDNERQERERLAAELAALQARATAPAPPSAPEAPAADPEMQKRLADLQARQDEIIASAHRDLTASREREADLQSQLAAAQQEVGVLRTRTAQVAVPVSAMEDAQAENQELRKRMDEVQRHNEELSAKLKTALRVADLIFKMRAGQVESVPPPRR